jgi:hypothetical protein
MPLVTCGPRSILLHCYYRLPFNCFIYILAKYYLLPLDTLNPLFTANRWDWQPHCKLGQCCVQVPRCCWCKATPWTMRHTYVVQSCHEASEHQPSEVGSFSYWFDKPWFHTEGRLAVVLIITFSWGFQLGSHLQNSYINTAPSTSFLAPLLERKRFCKGSLSLRMFYFVIFFFILFLLAYFYQKYKKISSFDSWYSVTFTFSSLCCSLRMLYRTLQ